MKFLDMLVLLLLSCSVLQAQDKISNDTLLNDSSRALEFQINQNFTLSTFEGTTVSFKHHLNAREALRYGVSLSVQSQKNDQSTPTNSMQTTKDDNVSYSASVNAFYICYTATAKAVYLYYGTGPIVGYAYSNAKQTSQGSPSVGSMSSEVKSKGKKSFTGLGALCGVECFVTKNISLCAEYSISALYTHNHTEHSESSFFSDGAIAGRYEVQATSGVFNLTSNGAKMGLVIYF